MLTGRRNAPSLAGLSRLLAGNVPPHGRRARYHGICPLAPPAAPLTFHQPRSNPEATPITIFLARTGSFCPRPRVRTACR